ncbi:unnamed protein product [Echinostoma caproni]|uniref:Eukaryotic translation initiation factor 4E-binding protein 1 n=1 Tax=Echinostoma caproni TaxID=27848 RepID=A0A183AUQ8_9TREM|nr:unnamed protein product [Echinostoma caproni]
MNHKRSDEIPVRRIRISDPSQIPSNVGTTPGGTLFSTTPGGTRIIYDRDFMLQCRNSPLSRTPPAELEKMLKAVSNPESNHSQQAAHTQVTETPEPNGPSKGDENPFEMDV